MDTTFLSFVHVRRQINHYRAARRALRLAIALALSGGLGIVPLASPAATHHAAGAAPPQTRGLSGYSAICWRGDNPPITTPYYAGGLTQAYIYWSEERGLYRLMYCNPGAQLPVGDYGAQLYTVGTATLVWAGIAMGALNHLVTYANNGRKLEPAIALETINSLR
jgi:hypothetical protein